MKVKADKIKATLAVKHADDFFITEVKDGPTQSVRNHFKLDALAFKKSWAHPAIIGYEIKVDRSDFLRDNKWPAYLPLCNQFSFVCPTGLIDPDELPQEVGLIFYNPEKGTLYTKRKALHRLIDEPVNMYKYIIMSKLDNERHPFFSDKRKYFEALVDDSADRRLLGYKVSQKLGEIIKETEKRCDELMRSTERVQEDAKQMDEVRKILNQNGVSTRWGWQDRLNNRLKSGVSEELRIEVWKINQSLARIMEMIGERKQEDLITLPQKGDTDI